VVAATAGRGTFAAFKAWANVDLPVPADPRCPDVVVGHFPDDGMPARYFGIPTPECEYLTELTVVGRHAVVASVVAIPKEPEPNDTTQHDISLGIVDLSSGAVVTRRISFVEDDWIRGLAPCGASRVCLAGMTGARSVDTGSTITFGDGFVLPVELTGEPGELRRVTSPRHSDVWEIATHPNGVLLFATVNGPITHTADGDPMLGFNEGLLALIEGF
jgi:hypothetical protein